MMRCCQCEGIETVFDASEAASMLEEYHSEGLRQTTQMLVDALKAEGVEQAELLDIGGGIGGVQHALLAAGAARSVHIDASSAYLQAAQQEADRLGLSDRIQFQHGDFVALASEIAPADVVTLDRVICCYHDMPGLVGRSVERARRLYGVVYPRDGWWIRLGVRAGNMGLWVSRSRFRIFNHPTIAVDGLIRSHGFRRRFHGQTWIWQVAVYAR